MPRAGRAPFPTEGVRARERLREVGEQVVGALDADREPHDILRDGELGAAHRRVGHLVGVVDERLHSAERLGELEQAGRLREPPRRRAVAECDRDDPAEGRHLASPRARDRDATRVPGSTRERPGRGPRGSRRRPWRSRCASACGSPSVLMPRVVSQASSGPETAPTANWRKRASSASASSSITSAPPTTSEWPPRYFVAECTTTSAPSAQGLLERGGGEGVVDDDERSRVVAEAGETGDVGDPQQRVARRLDPQDPRGSLLQRRRDGVEVAHVDDPQPDAPGPEDPRDEPVRPAVDVVAEQHLVAGLQDRAQQRVFGGEARTRTRDRGGRPRSRRAASRARCAWGCRCDRTRSPPRRPPMPSCA